MSMERAVQTMGRSCGGEHDEKSCVGCLDDEVVRNKRSDQRSRGTGNMLPTDPPALDIAQVLRVRSNLLSDSGPAPTSMILGA